jgi:hypothetical protein
MSDGALIETPGIGPATEGLSGFELLDAAQAAAANIVAMPTANQVLDVIAKQQLQVARNQSRHTQRKNRVYRAANGKLVNRRWETLDRPGERRLRGTRR